MDAVDFVPWIFAAVGPVLIVLGIRSLRQNSRFHKRAQQAYGVVTQVRMERSSQGRATAVPVVRFNLPDGRTVETEARWGAGPGASQTGQPVTVLYDPGNPTDIRLGGMLGSGHLSGVIMIFMGGAFFVMGAGIGSLFLLLESATS
jgi:hypothetical protein